MTRRVFRPCSHCAQHVDRFQHSGGVVAAYPCGCWHTPAQGRAIAAAAEQAAGGALTVTVALDGKAIHEAIRRAV